MGWPPSLLTVANRAAQDPTWAAELPALRDAIDVLGIEDVSDLANMFFSAEEARQYKLCHLWELARIANRPDTHLVQAALRAVAPPQCAQQPACRVRPACGTRIQKRPRVTPSGLRPDEARRADVATQLLSLSISWAPAAGLARGLEHSMAQRMLTTNTAAVARIARFELPTLKLVWRVSQASLARASVASNASRCPLYAGSLFDAATPS
eukprot:465034-Amphidinium_carterae.1